MRTETQILKDMNEVEEQLHQHRQWVSRLTRESAPGAYEPLQADREGNGLEERLSALSIELGDVRAAKPQAVASSIRKGAV